MSLSCAVRDYGSFEMPIAVLIRDDVSDPGRAYESRDVNVHYGQLAGVELGHVTTNRGLILVLGHLQNSVICPFARGADRWPRSVRRDHVRVLGFFQGEHFILFWNHQSTSNK